MHPICVQGISLFPKAWEKEVILKYLNPASPAGFIGSSQLCRHTKLEGLKVSCQHVRWWLESQDLFTAYRLADKKFLRQRDSSMGWTKMSCSLINMQMKTSLFVYFPASVGPILWKTKLQTLCENISNEPFWMSCSLINMLIKTTYPMEDKIADTMLKHFKWTHLIMALKCISKCWKLVFRTFPFMGMFDWEGALIPVAQWGKSNAPTVQ